MFDNPTESLPPQEAQVSASAFGGATVLNRVMTMAPDDHDDPRDWARLADAALQAVLQVWMPDFTPAGSSNALNWSAAGGSFTLIIPISFARCCAAGLPTVDSANATVFDIPSVTALIDFDCWKANSPVVGTEARLATLVPLPLRMSVVVPTQPK